MCVCEDHTVNRRCCSTSIMILILPWPDTSGSLAATASDHPHHLIRRMTCTHSIGADSTQSGPYVTDTKAWFIRSVFYLPEAGTEKLATLRRAPSIVAAASL